MARKSSKALPNLRRLASSAACWRRLVPLPGSIPFRGQPMAFLGPLTRRDEFHDRIAPQAVRLTTALTADAQPNERTTGDNANAQDQADSVGNRMRASALRTSSSEEILRSSKSERIFNSSAPYIPPCMPRSVRHFGTLRNLMTCFVTRNSRDRWGLGGLSGRRGPESLSGGNALRGRCGEPASPLASAKLPNKRTKSESRMSNRGSCTPTNQNAEPQSRQSQPSDCSRGPNQPRTSRAPSTGRKPSSCGHCIATTFKLD
jgi:hypothetical protein